MAIKTTGLFVRRSAGEAFELLWLESGHRQLLTLINATEDIAVLEDSYGSVIRIRIGATQYFGDRQGVTASVLFEWFDNGLANFVVSAPDSVRIMRNELLEESR